MSRYYSADILGSIEDTTDASGTTTVNHQEFDAFGNLFSSSGPTPSPFQYCGRQGYQTDKDSGLQLLGNRYYDPALIRSPNQSVRVTGGTASNCGVLRGL